MRFDFHTLCTYILVDKPKFCFVPHLLHNSYHEVLAKVAKTIAREASAKPNTIRYDDDAKLTHRKKAYWFKLEFVMCNL